MEIGIQAGLEIVRVDYKLTKRLKSDYKYDKKYRLQRNKNLQWTETNSNRIIIHNTKI